MARGVFPPIDFISNLTHIYLFIFMSTQKKKKEEGNSENKFRVDKRMEGWTDMLRRKSKFNFSSLVKNKCFVGPPMNFS